ncbi:MAG: hypothetical protein EOR67_21025 [Mesorhizobium sp.]|uniref:hypothetical protein n=1 Tax=Mesorhizobium sp. TaxID=1871066 RepID=UPI000FE68F50|nr:hypothetical protein [Mesorhizobium sp.]RWL80296.1 MAG: hypothetical protein EOR69_22625 [Mesorhizobium sp.]RWL85919.1 MAG: hypothetical protein EOR67_21025 [Mesorhizobium sp.]RWL93130.1 MAG: hypothetical protein EOR70_29415 [Mesorhizobium sp.]
MSKPNTPSEFYEAIGLAVTQWSRVEDAFCDLFCRLVLCAITGGGIGKPEGEGFFILGNVFYSTTNFRSRLDLLDHMMSRLVFNNDALHAEWSAIKNKGTRLYSRRNVLAHGTVWGNEDKGGALFVRYSIFDAKARQEMDYQRVWAATPSFARYAERITQLAIDVNRHLAGRKRKPEDAAH